MNSRIDRLHKWSLYAVVLVGFLAMATGGMLGTATTALFLVGLAVSWVVDRAGWGDRSHTFWWNLLAGAFFLGTAGLVIFADQGIIAGIRFLLVLTIIKLLSRHRIRDELQLYALAFVMMAAATAVNDDIFYGMFFGLFVLGGLLVGLATSLFIPGALIGFSGVVFAFGGYALTTRPVA
ncbi:MAG: hypothetical protein ABEN55_20140, partial [Bradymonadaceae bacterium]